MKWKKSVFETADFFFFFPEKEDVTVDVDIAGFQIHAIQNRSK